MDPIKDLLRRPAFWYLLLVLAAMGWVGDMDYEDAVLQQNHYCKMVASGYWPDYNETYRAECPPLGYPAVPGAYRAATLGAR